MTKEMLADQLNGREYGEEIRKEEILLAKDNNLVVVFGASDDLMEFEGMIQDEIGCYNGGVAYLDKNGLMSNACDDDCCPYFAEKIKEAYKIEAVWAQGGYGWTYKTEIPHVKFTIFDNGDPYCEGIVFNFSSLSN